MYSLCMNEKCLLKETCYRFRTEFTPDLVGKTMIDLDWDSKNSCDYYVDINSPKICELRAKLEQFRKS